MDLFKTENIDQLFSSNKCLLGKKMKIKEKNAEKSKSSLGYCHGNKLCITVHFLIIFSISVLHLVCKLASHFLNRYLLIFSVFYHTNGVSSSSHLHTDFSDYFKGTGGCHLFISL